MNDTRVVLDLAERREALDPARSFIVQAPAGSGKTELLTQRYLALLARVAHPEEIVAITFTRKAANEMRNRVLGALEAGARDARPNEEHKALTWDLARAALAQNAARGWDLGANPGRLRISTIDSFCAALTRQMPLLTRFGAPPATVEDAQPLYREAARELLADLEEGRQWSAAIERLLLHLDNDLARVEELLADMLARRDQWMRHLADSTEGRRRDRFEAGLKDLIRAALARLRGAWTGALSGELVSELLALARYAGGNLAAAKSDSKIAHCAALRFLPGEDVADLPPWEALAALLLTNEGAWRASVNVKQGFPADDGSSGKARSQAMKQRFLALLAALRNHDDLRRPLDGVRALPPPVYDDAQWQVLEALCELLPLAAAKLWLTFQRRGQTDFTEVAWGALRALGGEGEPTDLALKLDYRIQHLLVDEFQDTSVSQYQLLARLTAGWQPNDGRTLFVVGDPMQSIYRFRQAEVGLYLRARHEGIGEARPGPLYLHTNFRSSKGIVDWVNGAFAQILPVHEDIGAGAVPYAAATAHHPAAPGQTVTVHPLFSPDPLPEAQQVVALARAALDRRSDETVAILVRTRAHLAQIAPRLKEASLRFRALDIEHLGERPVVQDLLALTRALTHPADRIAWLAVLRAPWCGLTLADLEVLAGDERRSAVWTLMQDPARLARLGEDGQMRLARTRAALAQVLAQRRRLRLRRCVEGAWLALGAPACVAEARDLEDARAYFELLEEVEAGGDLMDGARLSERVEELFAAPDVTASDRLQLMTVHKAKGLEFDTVIVPGLGRKPRHETPRLLLWMERPRGGHGGQPADLLLAPIHATGREQDRIYEYLKRLDAERNAHEAGRLLYVVATRARKYLHLLGHVGVTDRDGRRAPGAPQARSLLHHLWPVVKRDFEAAFEAAPGVAPAAGAAAPVALPQGIRRLTRAWVAPPPPPAVAWRAAAVAPLPEEAPPVEFDWASETIRHVGTVAHQLLHVVGREGLARWDAARLVQLRPAFGERLARLGVPRAELARAGTRVEQALARTLGDARGRWIFDPGHREARCEYSLSAFEGNRLVTVVMDRSFVDAGGVRWIIDYKTSSHEGAGLEEFLDRERERYREQLERYARFLRTLGSRPIRLGLYFPLLGGWREWTPGP